MKTHCLINHNQGIGTIPKPKKQINNIYYGNIQNGYDKGDLLDANATIDQIQYYLKEYDDQHTSSDQKIITFTINLPDQFEYNKVYQNIVNWDQDLNDIDKYSSIRTKINDNVLLSEFAINNNDLLISAKGYKTNPDLEIFITIKNKNSNDRNNTQTVMFNYNWNTL